MLLMSKQMGIPRDKMLKMIEEIDENGDGLIQLREWLV